MILNNRLDFFSEHSDPKSGFAMMWKARDDVYQQLTDQFIDYDHSVSEGVDALLTLLKGSENGI
jgi:shikimate kinase